MKNVETRRLAIAAAVMVGLAGCTTFPSNQPVSVPLTQTTIGSVVPVYNPPPNTPFRCIGAGDAITMFSVPGDPNALPRLPIATPPVATMGNRRGDWLLVVTHTGEIGWIDEAQEESFSQEYPGQWCHVHQDAEGRIVFDYQLTHGAF
jgi:hypothetical protein